MKIGILTFPFNNNYGGYLQAYAVLTVLKSMGHDVEIIYRRYNRHSLLNRTKTLLTNILKYCLGRKVVSIIPDQEKSHRYRGALMMSFVDKHIIPCTVPLYSSEDLYKQISICDYDVIVIGSDQVWRPDIGPKHVQDFFLAELQSVLRPKRISYAASFGNDHPCFTEKEIEECGRAISHFSAVSVREKSGLSVIKKFHWKTKNQPVMVLDPTLLLSSSHYNSLLPQDFSISKNKIFCYILDNNQETSELISIVSKQTELEVYNILDVNWKGSLYVMPSIEAWLSGIRDAELVITDSFHGMVFSIIFRKPFIVKCNESRGADRFISLLESLGLENRLIYNADSIHNVISQDIDWTLVEMKLNVERNKSLNFLLDAVS